MIVYMQKEPVETECLAIIINEDIAIKTEYIDGKKVLVVMEEKDDTNKPL